MSWQAVIMYCVVAFVGVPASFRNLTALAMIAAWLSVEFVYQITGDSLPLKYSFMADIAVIAVIYAKTIKRCGAKLYSSMVEQMRCLVTDLTPCDRWIVAIFLLGAWPVYLLSIDPWWKWMALWALAISQFMLASGEALADLIEARREARKPTPIIDRHLVVIPFPIQRRGADAVTNRPKAAGVLTAIGSGGGSG